MNIRNMFAHATPIPGTDLRVSYEEIEPKDAQYLLEHNYEGNRPLRRMNVERLAREMNLERWHLTHQPIGVDKHLKVIDGQHRLCACVQSGHRIRVLFVFGLDRDAFAGIDVGRKRALSDQLRTSKEVASCWTALYNWLNYGPKKPNSANEATVEDIEQLMGDCQEFGDSINWSLGHKFPPCTFTASMVSVLHWEFNQAVEDGGAQFLEPVQTGVGLEEGSPLLRLHRMVVQWAIYGEKLSPKLTEHRYALAIKAWNAWIAGREVKILRWQDSEDFPSILQGA